MHALGRIHTLYSLVQVLESVDSDMPFSISRSICSRMMGKVGGLDRKGYHIVDPLEEVVIDD